MSTVYAVKWTTPHCVLALRLIGLTYDIYDGHQKPVFMGYMLTHLHNIYIYDIFVVHISSIICGKLHTDICL